MKEAIKTVAVGAATIVGVSLMMGFAALCGLTVAYGVIKLLVWLGFGKDPF